MPVPASVDCTNPVCDGSDNNDYNHSFSDVGRKVFMPSMFVTVPHNSSVSMDHAISVQDNRDTNDYSYSFSDVKREVFSSPMSLD